jgi:putative membrane protein
MSETIQKEAQYKRLILITSIILPLAVAGLFGIEIKGYDLTFLPPIYATINGFTVITLVTALIAVKQKQFLLHERLIKLCMLFSLSFLLMYVSYHATSDSTHFGGEGVIKYIYYFILITHIILSIVVIPFVLYAFMFGMTKQIQKHKKLVRFAFPLWLYVAITGVVVYVMISPYY